MPRPKFQPVLPKLAPDLKLQPHDFLSVIGLIPEGCPMIGGQAVAFWANRYGTAPANDPITSKDIDFWGSHDDVVTLAKRLKRPAIFPHAYEMAIWAGAIEITVKGQTTLVEMLHTVPGLDTNQPDQAALTREIQGTQVYVLSPVSLVLAKLHALRNFDQEHRQDKRHLLMSIVCTAKYVSELLSNQHVRLALRECERVIRAHMLKSTRRLESQHGFNLLDAIPVATMQTRADELAEESVDHRRLCNFLQKRWPEVSK